MNFKLGQKVKTRVSNHPQMSGGINGKGTIVTAGFLSGQIGGKVYYSVRTEGGATYNYLEEFVSEIKVKTLYAYTDSTEEVHWATKNYNPKELKEFGYTRADSFDKTIDLE